MKILYLSNTRLPTVRAHGIQIMKMCEAFALAGHDVELLIPRIRGLSEDVFLFYGVRRNFRVRYLPCLKFRMPKLERVMFLLMTLTFLFSARVHAWRNGCDVIYTREQLAGLFFRRHILELHKLPARIGLWRRLLWKRARGIVVISDGLAERLRGAGIPGGNIFVAPDGVDVERFDTGMSKEEARERTGLPQDRNIVMYSGHLMTWKGVDVLAEAARRLSEHLFVFVGGTDKRIREFRERFGDMPNVRILGRKPYEQIPLYLAAADVLVLPNSAIERISSHYTSPLKLFEYMAAGRPIVASDLPSIREILSEETVFFAEPDSFVSLATAIETVLIEPDKATSRAQEARILVNQYSWENRARNIAAFLMPKAGTRL